MLRSALNLKDLKLSSWRMNDSKKNVRRKS